MDIIGGLTAAKLALDLTKDLREIDRSVDDATFNLKLSELTFAMADTQVALVAAKVKVSELEDALEIEKSGLKCPSCKVVIQKVISIEAGNMNDAVQFHRCECNASDCNYSSQRFFDCTINECRSQVK